MLPILNTDHVGDEELIVIDDNTQLSRQAYEQKIREQFDRVQSDMIAHRNDWVQHRAQSGVEDRWRKAQRLVLTEEQGVEAALAEALNGQRAARRRTQRRSKVIVNIVRPKVEQAIARICEILLPVDDKNWAIKPTPIASAVQKMLGDNTPTVNPDGSPSGFTADVEASALIQAAKEAAKEMEKVIDDVLTECDYNAEQRKGIIDGVTIGTMVIKGPYPTKQSTKFWQAVPGGGMEMVFEEKTVPASQRVDPWDIFPDPACGDDHQRGQGIWHRRFVTRKELRNLVGIPGFNSDAIRQVLRTAPTRVAMANGRVIRQTGRDRSYELWEYHGEIEPDMMTMCSYGTGDPLEDVDFGIVLMVNDYVIGAMPSWIVDRTLPYDFWCWTKASDSPFGYGLPHQLEHQQSVVTAAWRQVMDSARVTAGPQIIFGKGVAPENGVYELEPNKLWRADQDVADVTKAFAQFQFQSNLKDLIAIAETAKKFADEETSMPQILGGQGGSTPETVGGMTMMMANAQSVLRLRVKLYDDNITRPHIGRHYDYQMATNPRSDIKGDNQVDARGSSALVERDIQNQALLQLGQVTADPRFAPFVNPLKELKIILKGRKLNPEDILFTDEEMKQQQEAAAQQPQQQDPRLAAAQMQAEMKQVELADRKESRQMELQLAQEELSVKRESLAYNVERERADSEQQIVNAQLQRDLQLAKMAADGQESELERQSRERLEATKLDSKHSLFNAEAALRVNTGAGI